MIWEGQTVGKNNQCLPHLHLNKNSKKPWVSATGSSCWFPTSLLSGFLLSISLCVTTVLQGVSASVILYYNLFAYLFIFSTRWCIFMILFFVQYLASGSSPKEWGTVGQLHRFELAQETYIWKQPGTIGIFNRPLGYH